MVPLRAGESGPARRKADRMTQIGRALVQFERGCPVVREQFRDAINQASTGESAQLAADVRESGANTPGDHSHAGGRRQRKQ